MMIATNLILLSATTVAAATSGAALGHIEREAWNHAAEQIAAGTGLAVRERAAELLEEYAARSTRHGSDEWLLFGEATEEMRALRVPGADETPTDPSIH